VKALAVFIVSAWLAILFWGSLAPREEHKPVPLDGMPAYTRQTVCAGQGYPVSVIRTMQLPSMDLYQVTCSSGITVPSSW
jgi:hypothetical protein